MEIDVSKIEEETLKFKQLIKDYEICYSMLYDVMFDMKPHWIDSHAILFFNDVEKEKKYMKKNIDEIEDIVDVYNYMAKEYIKIGQKINVDMSRKEIIIDEIDVYINQINDILNMYNDLDLSYYSNSLVNDHKKRIMSVKNKAQELKSDLEKIYSNIEQIELNIKNKLEQISIQKLTIKSEKQYL